MSLMPFKDVTPRRWHGHQLLLEVFNTALWRPGYTPGWRSNQLVYCIALVQPLYISCYVLSNKLVLPYLWLCLLPLFLQNGTAAPLEQIQFRATVPRSPPTYHHQVSVAINLWLHLHQARRPFFISFYPLHPPPSWQLLHLASQAWGGLVAYWGWWVGPEKRNEGQQ
jgi:hypothetical protein